MPAATAAAPAAAHPAGRELHDIQCWFQAPREIHSWNGRWRGFSGARGPPGGAGHAIRYQAPRRPAPQPRAAQTPALNRHERDAATLTRAVVKFFFPRCIFSPPALRGRKVPVPNPAPRRALPGFV